MSWAWLTAVFSADVAVLVLVSHLTTEDAWPGMAAEGVGGRVSGEAGARAAALAGPLTVLLPNWVGTGCRNAGSHGCLPNSTADVGEHSTEPVGGVIDGEALGVMARRRRTTQGRGERI